MTAPTTAPADTPPQPSSPASPITRIFRILTAAGLVLLAAWYAFSWTVATRHHTLAQEQLHQRHFTTALAHLAWCRWASPRDPAVWLLSARTARRAGQYDQATEWLDRAQSLGARKSRVRRERALLYAQQGRFAEVEETLHALLRSSPSDYPAIAEVLTGEYMRQYRFPEARALLNRWIDLYPQDEEAWLRRAWVAEHQFDVYTALSDYRRVLELAPDRVPVRLRLVELLLKIRRPTNAARELEPLHEQRPEDLESALLLARCCRELGQLDRAADVLDRLPGSLADSPRVRGERGQLAFARGRHADAVPLLQGALRELPRETDLLYALQQSLVRLGRTAEAEEVGRTLKESDADGRRLGELLRALAQKPNDAAMRYECGMIFLRNNLLDDAIRWLKMALEVDPKHRRAHEQLAACYEKQGQSERAASHRTAAERLTAEGGSKP